MGFAYRLLGGSLLEPSSVKTGSGGRITRPFGVSASHGSRKSAQHVLLLLLGQQLSLLSPNHRVVLAPLQHRSSRPVTGISTADQLLGVGPDLMLLSGLTLQLRTHVETIGVGFRKHGATLFGLGEGALADCSCKGDATAISAILGDLIDCFLLFNKTAFVQDVVIDHNISGVTHFFFGYRLHFFLLGEVWCATYHKSRTSHLRLFQVVILVVIGAWTEEHSGCCSHSFNGGKAFNRAPSSSLLVNGDGLEVDLVALMSNVRLVKLRSPLLRRPKLEIRGPHIG